HSEPPRRLSPSTIPPPPPRSTLFPYTTLFRSGIVQVAGDVGRLGAGGAGGERRQDDHEQGRGAGGDCPRTRPDRELHQGPFLTQDRKSTRLNSSHRTISYAVFCLKKKKRIMRT